MAEYSLSTMIEEVEQALGLPKGAIRPFFQAEEHWVFVLKTASIVETVLKSALLARLRPFPVFTGPPSGIGSFLMGGDGDSALRDHIFRIPIKGDIGAVALARGHNILAKEDEDFIAELASLRNRHAHSILNHSKSVLEILSERKDNNQLKTTLAKLSYRRAMPFKVDGMDPGIAEIEFGVLMFLAGVSGRFQPFIPQAGGILGGILGSAGGTPPDPT